MAMTSRVRKFTLTAHIIVSVGWLGAVAAFLGLALAGLYGKDGQNVRAAYLAMEIIAWYVILPLAFASLATGLIESLGTTWGVFRHHWVTVKLVITILATAVLLTKLKLISYLARVAATTTLSSADLRQSRIELLVHAAGGVLVLLVPTVLSVYKPWGLTAYGRRKQTEKRKPYVASSLDLKEAFGPTATRATDKRRPRWIYVVGIHAAGLILLLVILHLTGGHMHGH